ncbi:MAG: endonuclease III domain-containing protein [Verrucomicrobiota bacterium]|jgi:endonuclease-3 related protein
MPPNRSRHSAAPALRRAYARLRAAQGHQHWWPAQTPFEVCVGAILTQNTSWTNVERALANLRATGALTAETLYSLPPAKLRECLRPAGYFNVKARRLRAFLAVLIEQYGGQLERLFAGDTPAVRARLLAIHGIGPETADSMLLYAGGHARFVVDAYTRRIFARHGWCGPDASYDELQVLCEGALKRRGADAQLDYWQDYHAQLVMVGKHHCRARDPRCDACPLQTLLPAGGLRPLPSKPPTAPA